MKRALLVRLHSLPDRTLGNLYIFNGLAKLGQFTTLELPWRDNEVKRSCIPEGDYRLSLRVATPKFPYPHLWVHDTEPRQAILMHRGNFPKDTEGCILVGMGFGSADGDGLPDVLASTVAMNQLVQLIPEEPIPFTVIDLAS